MTFEEIQQIIQEMLRVQRELQESQVRQSTEIEENSRQIQALREESQETSRQIQALIEQGREQDRRIQQLIGYSISQAGDVIDVQMALRDIYARLSKLEDKNNNE